METQKAKYRLGWAYQYGLGVEKDTKKSLLSLTESAEGNYALARWKLALRFMNGVNVSKDSKMAITLLTDLDFPVAKLCLWHLHQNEPTDVQHLEKTKEYWEAVLKIGVVNTMIDLRMKYMSRKDGHGINKKQALLWFNYAIEQDHGNSEALAAISCINLPNGPYPYSYLEGKQRNGMKYYIKILNNGKSSAVGCVSGLSCLGYTYHKGLGVQPNFKKALDIYLSVLLYIDDEDSDTNMCLGLLYAKALGVERNEKEAVRYFLRSANSKHPNTYVYNLLGDTYKMGKGVEVDYNWAMYWYTLGAHYCDAYSIFNAEHLKVFSLEEKEGTKKYFSQAFHGCEPGYPYWASVQNAVSFPHQGKPNHYDYPRSGPSLDNNYEASGSQKPNIMSLRR